MFGKNKKTAAAATTTITTDTEPAHIFDQTNGVLRRFDEYTGTRTADQDIEDQSRKMIGSAIIQSGIAGGNV